MANVRNLPAADVLAHGLAELRNPYISHGARRQRRGNANEYALRLLQRFPGWPWLAMALCKVALQRASAPFALWVSSIASPPGLHGGHGYSDSPTPRLDARRALEYARLLAWLDAAAGTSQAMRAKRVEALRVAQRSSAANIRLNASIALSRALYDVGASAEALVAGEAALQIAPENPQALRAQAYAFAANDRFPEARGILHRLLECQPGSHDLRRRLKAIEDLPERVPRLESATSPAHAPLLIGVGGGIGDILHSTPLIRHLARRMGTPVDVLVLADHAEAGFLVRNPEFVAHVFVLSNESLDRRYDTVFLTHCFGPLRFRFNAGRVVTSSDWMAFRPGRLHETLFHLEAAKQLLGIDYDQADVRHYFAGNLRYITPSDPLIGFHAGSKGGRWLSKRWPHFGELATRLRARGFRVASFGTPDEYVHGTEDRTGGSIEAMCQSMMACSHFVSNDSGPLHIANALGIPALAMFAPTDPLTHLPLGAMTEGLMLEKYCTPCEVRNHRHFAAAACHCIGEVSVEVVETRLLARLATDVSGRATRHPPSRATPEPQS